MVTEMSQDTSNGGFFSHLPLLMAAFCSVPQKTLLGAMGPLWQKNLPFIDSCGEGSLSETALASAEQEGFCLEPSKCVEMSKSHENDSPICW